MVNNTSPVFFYCSAPGSCITYGMVGAINPNASMSISYQQDRAKRSAYMLNPGEPFPPESPLSSTTPSATSTPMDSAGFKKHGLPAGTIAGIAVATVAVVVIIVLIILLCRRRLRKSIEQGPNAYPIYPHSMTTHDGNFIPQRNAAQNALGPSSIVTSPGSPDWFPPVPWRSAQPPPQELSVGESNDHKTVRSSLGR